MDSKQQLFVHQKNVDKSKDILTHERFEDATPNDTTNYKIESAIQQTYRKRKYISSSSSDSSVEVTGCKINAAVNISPSVYKKMRLDMNINIITEPEIEIKDQEATTASNSTLKQIEKQVQDLTLHEKIDMFMSQVPKGNILIPTLSGSTPPGHDKAPDWPMRESTTSPHPANETMHLDITDGILEPQIEITETGFCYLVPRDTFIYVITDTDLKQIPQLTFKEKMECFMRNVEYFHDNYKLLQL